MAVPWKRTLWILWAGVTLCNSGNTMVNPFLPLFLMELGVGEDAVNGWSSLVYVVPFLVGIVMSLIWGAIADKYGKRKMIIRAGLSLTVVFALLSLVQTPWQLVAARALQGIVGGFVPAAMAIVSSATPEKQLGWSLGMMYAGTMAGGVTGPLMGALLSTWFGLRTSFLVAGLLIFIATIAVVLWVREGNNPMPAAGGKAEGRGGLWRVLTNRTLLNILLLIFIYQLCINMLQPFLTLHIAALQGSLQGAALSSGLVFALIALAGIIASPLWGKAAQARGYSNILSVCLIAAGIFAYLQFFVERLALFALIQFIFGLFVAGIIPTVNTLLMVNAGDGNRAKLFGITNSSSQLGAVIGPLIGGGLALFLDLRWIFALTGAILAIAGLGVRLRGVEQREPPRSA